MATELPVTLTRYIVAQNDLDAERMAACFAPDATVHDEGHTYVGRDAIREWKLATIAKYAISIEPLEAAGDARRLAVKARVTGNFPGSPADLTYGFVLDEAGLICELVIG